MERRSLLRSAVGPFRQFYLPFRAKPKAKIGLPDLFSKYIKKDDIVAEVGAYLGGSTIVLSSLARQVYAFEPNRISFKVLKHAAGRMSNVFVFNVAIGSRPAGETWLSTLDKYSAEATSSIKMIPQSNYRHMQRVHETTLDAFGFATSPTALVSDCEGYEVEVLEGARKSLSTLRTVLIETHRLKDSSSTYEIVSRKLHDSHYSKVESVNVGDWLWVVATR